MRTVLVVALAILCTSVAHAEVPRRTFKTLGDVAYFPQDGERSCGKESRDLLKKAVKAIRTVTVTSKQVRTNNAEPWTIMKEDSDGVYAGSSYPAPTEAHPHRTITWMMSVIVVGDDTTFLIARNAEDDGDSCTDVYRVTIE